MSAVVLSAIPFRSSHFNRFIIEKALSQLTNVREHSTFSVQSLLSGGNCPVSPLVAGLVTLQLLQNCFPRISGMFARVWCCDASLNKNFFLSEWIVFSTLEGTVVCHCYWWRNTFPPS